MRDFWGTLSELGVARRVWGLLFWLLVRMVLGMGSIYYINQLLADRQINLYVGYNIISLLTSGSLGFSGVVLLYAICACKFL